MNRPNVWFIMVDQLRWDAMGCYGNEIVETAHLDHIAAQGTVFENCYTPAPRCVPARASLTTSKNPWHTGNMYPDLEKGTVQDLGTTLPGVFAAAGYHTQHVGSAVGVPPHRALHGYHDVRTYSLSSAVDSDYKHWFERNKPAGYESTNNGMGPNSWISRPWELPEYLHPVAWTAQESIRFLERRDPTRPFFLKTSFLRPHAPYDPPPYYFDLYNAQDLPAPVTGNDWDEKYNVPTTEVNAQSGRLQPRQIHRAKAGYYGLIHFIDHQIGVVMQHLRKSGLADNTVIVFTSDHGDMLSDHHMHRKCVPYEGAAHIPLLVRLPASHSAVQARSAAPVSLLDVMPTLLDACGLEIPEGLDGRSVLPVMRGEQNLVHEYVHGEHTRVASMDNFEHHFITDGKWKYIWLTQSNEEQLFHLESDPYEQDNLATSPAHAQELLKWRERMIADLQQRNAGLVEDGKLVAQKGKPIPVSPHYNAIA